MKVYKVIGLMSGTSLDGLDMAYCHIWQENNKWHYDIKQTLQIPYENQMRVSLEKAIHLLALNLLSLHKLYGVWLGDRVREFISENNLQVDFVSSHGHTVHHRPQLGLTYQLGCGQELANHSHCDVINDFRSKDVSLKGQGAPLVPIGDALFFSEYDFCLNLGGISNMSFDKEGKRIAYDIGLANMPLNYIVQKINLVYDSNGDLARKGRLNTTLFNQLNALNYYQQPIPKSTGYEWFLDAVVPLIDGTEDTIENKLHTLIHHNCAIISKEIAAHKTADACKILVTGGGALNAFYMEVLNTYLAKGEQLIIPNKTLIDYKEALVFALMGVLKMEHKINCLSSATGAKRDSSSGVIYHYK
jgi:anhydro-N-acetylmuramic acid kinase